MLQSAHNYDNRVCLTAAGGEDGGPQLSPNKQTSLPDTRLPATPLPVTPQAVIESTVESVWCKTNFCGPKKKAKRKLFYALASRLLCLAFAFAFVPFPLSVFAHPALGGILHAALKFYGCSRPSTLAPATAAKPGAA